jgi:hypothetical protein
MDLFQYHYQYLADFQKNSRLSTLREDLTKYSMFLNRPICPVCNKQPCAANYTKNGIRHYRSRCASCIKKNKNIPLPVPRWKLKGYKKKATCDLCGFKSQYASQIIVYHIDGNQNNCELINLRSICLCCVEIVKRKHITWKIGDIEADH